MGQRHQIYIRLPKIVSKYSGDIERKELTIGFHQQWLYGATAVQVLDNFLCFYKRAKNDKYNAFVTDSKDAVQTCMTVLSYLPRSGQVERLHDMNGKEEGWRDCISNPKCGDNNDGITIIDLKCSKPKYAFGSLGHTEGKLSLSEGLYPASDYLASYYPELQGDYKQVQGRDSSKAGDMPARMKRLAKVEMLTPERVSEIFPAWGGMLALKTLGQNSMRTDHFA